MRKATVAFLIDCQIGGLSPATISMYRGVLDNFSNSLPKEKGLEEICPNDVRSYLQSLRNRPRGRSRTSQGLAPTTIKTYFATIRAFFSWAVREGLVESVRNPMRAIRTPKAPRKVIPSLDGDSLSGLLKTWDSSRASDRRNRVIIVTLLDTGLRASELLGLRFDDFDPARGSLTVDGKGSRQRRVPISTRVAEMLTDYIETVRPRLLKGQTNGYLFLSQGGHPLKATELARIVRQAKAEAGINSGTVCTPHILRHTFALSWCRNGGNSLFLQKILGHSSLEMTRRYVDESFDDLAEAHKGRSPAETILEGDEEDE